jgi:hypothetical protein
VAETVCGYTGFLVQVHPDPVRSRQEDSPMSPHHHFEA